MRVYAEAAGSQRQRGRARRVSPDHRRYAAPSCITSCPPWARQRGALCLTHPPPGGTAVCRRRGPRHGVRMQGQEPPQPPPLKSAVRKVGRPPGALAAGAACARWGAWAPAAPQRAPRRGERCIACECGNGTPPSSGDREPSLSASSCWQGLRKWPAASRWCSRWLRRGPRRQSPAAPASLAGWARARAAWAAAARRPVD